MRKRLYTFIFETQFRKLILILFDILCFAAVDLAYFFLSGQVSYSTPVYDSKIYLYNTLLLCACIFVFRFIFKVYSNVWRYTNTGAYFRMVVSDAFGGFSAILLSRFVVGHFVKGLYIGIWYGVTVTAISALLTLMSRFTYRLLYKLHNEMDTQSMAEKPRILIAIIGAGQLGAHLAKELMNTVSSHYLPVCFIDVDKTKIGNRVVGLPVFNESDSDKIIDKYRISEVVIAINGLSYEKNKSMWKMYTSYGCKVKIYDSPIHEENVLEEDKKRIIRDFEIEDLLFRQPLDISNQSEFSYYSGKTVLITGGGGSIGSELCRQIAKCSPKKLVIFDIYENNTYDIQQELTKKYGSALDLSVEIGSVRDVERLECIFRYYHPDVVFHAAAHKHVPLMEHSCAEAIKNNVMGTYNTANMAEKYNTEKFILISTDKAVNPTNIMGASKRLCEMVVQCRTDSKTIFTAVRFGNVLGSNGSVIPLFKRQIASGGPVTITDKRIIRYFMTIPEASQLVMHAGAKAENGELFVLNMGEPIKIYDLAVSMIKLMGYVPEKDIEIKEIGLRPGEKLYEELLMKGETLIKTDNEMIFIEKDTPYSRKEVDDKIAVLMEAVESCKYQVDSDAVRRAIKATVPTFKEPEVINKNADASEEMKKINCTRESRNAGDKIEEMAGASV